MLFLPIVLNTGLRDPPEVRSSAHRGLGEATADRRGEGRPRRTRFRPRPLPLLRGGAWGLVSLLYAAQASYLECGFDRLRRASSSPAADRERGRPFCPRFVTRLPRRARAP